MRIRHSVGSLLSLGVFLLGSTAAQVVALQTVYVNFDTYTVPADDPNDHVYTAAEREEITSILEGLFRADPNDPGGGPYGPPADGGGPYG